jgi:glycopeptide antibiotics resistance protein
MRNSRKEKKTMEMEKQNTLTVVLFVVYILLLTGIIIFKLPFYSPELSDGVRIINLIPVQGSFDENGVILLREIIYNILIFIPLGVYVCMLKREWPFMKKIFPVISLTLAFEITQFIFAVGRSDITDILGNTLGGIAGIGIYALLFRIFKNKAAKTVNILALALTVCAVSRFASLFYFSHFIM